MKLLVFLAAALAAGAALAWAAVTLWVPTGWIGGAGLFLWAVLARRRWAKLESATGLEPGAPERVLWVNLAGDGLILGHLATALSLPVPFRFGLGNSLALDVWTLIGAYFLTFALFRADSREADERHATVAARGVRAGYAALALMLVALALYLALAPAAADVTPWLLAHGLIALLLASHTAMIVAQLASYARDTRSVVVDEPAP